MKGSLIAPLILLNNLICTNQIIFNTIHHNDEDEDGDGNDDNESGDRNLLCQNLNQIVLITCKSSQSWSPSWLICRWFLQKTKVQINHQRFMLFQVISKSNFQKLKFNIFFWFNDIFVILLKNEGSQMNRALHFGRNPHYLIGKVFSQLGKISFTRSKTNSRSSLP